MMDDLDGPWCMICTAPLELVFEPTELLHMRVATE